MVTAARNDKEKSIRNKSWKNDPSDPPKPTTAFWDRRWDAQMFRINKLTEIRNFVAHLPNETVPKEEFDEKWTDAVFLIKCLGVTQEEIDQVSTLNPPAQQGQAELLKILVKGQDKVEYEDANEIKGELNTKHVNPIVVNKKNELRASSLKKRGDSNGRSGDWDQALKFYTQAVEIPDISDDLRKKIYMNRSWVHWKVLNVPKPPFRLNTSESEDSESVTKMISEFNDGKIPGQTPSRASKQDLKFVDERFLEIDPLKRFENLTDEVKEFHLNAGMADVEAALQLSTDQNCPRAFHRIAQFHQLKGDWNSALTYFDLALDQSNLDENLEFDRNVCQLEMLNQAEVEEFDWIPGQKNQTMAGIAVRRNPQKWLEAMLEALKTSEPGQQLYGSVLMTHLMAQGISGGDPDQVVNELQFAQTEKDFDQIVKLYEGAAKEGLPSGFYNLGLLLQEGNGVQQDFSGAVRLFKMAAHSQINDSTPDWMKEGALEAQYRLGLCYEFGLGVGKDNKKALHWYETASLGDFAKASRKLGDIYSQGRLGVPKDDDMAIFCWEQALSQGDSTAETSAALHHLKSPPLTWLSFSYSLYCFSSAIQSNSRDGTPTMLAAILDRKRHFQNVLATALYDLSHNNIKENIFKLNKNEGPEPEEVSWNVPALVEHTLHTIHLLELAQTPEFLQKLEATPNWRKKFTFTERLLKASISCVEGLAAFQALNKLYRKVIGVKFNEGQVKEVDYPPDLRSISISMAISGVRQAILQAEAQLVAVILESFANSIRLVGAAYFCDELTQQLIKSLVDKVICGNLPEAGVAPTSQQLNNYFNAALIISYTLILKGVKGDCEMSPGFSPRVMKMLEEPCLAIFAAAVQGSLGIFEVAAGDLEEFSKNISQNPDFVSKCDLLFVQALCCKSAAMTRGVNTANRKKVNEAITMLKRFLSICPKDEPRRAEAYYQLALCTFYLEKMKVKGQVKTCAKDILNKVRSHFTQGEEAEQEFPWKDQFSHESSFKLFVQQKMKELEALIKKSPAKKLMSQEKLENPHNLCFGRFLDPFFKFPAASFPLKMRSSRRVEVITQYRKFFKAAMDQGLGSSSFMNSMSPLSLQMEELKELVNLPGNPLSVSDVIIRSTIVCCYEIVEPVLHFRVPPNAVPTEHQEPNLIGLFTVVQDDSGSVFNLQLHMKHQEHEVEDKVGEIREFRKGARIIFNRANLRLDMHGWTSLLVVDADIQAFHLTSTSKPQQQHGKQDVESGMAGKCGYCGKIGGDLEKCPKCKVVYYCDKECQTSDWNELKHDWICPFL